MSKKKILINRAPALLTLEEEQITRLIAGGHAEVMNAFEIAIE